MTDIDYTSSQSFKINVYRNNVVLSNSAPVDYTVGALTSAGFVPITIASGRLTVGDTVKITYSSSGVSAPFTEYLDPDVFSGVITGGFRQYDISEYLGDNNYMPFVDLRVLGDNASASFPNTFSCTSYVDIKNGDRIAVSGVDSNGIFSTVQYPAWDPESPIPVNFYVKNVQYVSTSATAVELTFQLATFKSGTTIGPAIPLQVIGDVGELTFSIDNNLIVEINGVRMGGAVPTELSYDTSDPTSPLATYLSFQVPVYSLESYDVNFLTVKVNGVEIPYNTPYNVNYTAWRTNYDPISDTFAGWDADYGFPNSTLGPITGFFDDGTPFDNQATVSVVFANGYLQPGDVITIEYNVLGNEWDSGNTYAENDLVSYNGMLFRSLQGGNTNNQPDISPLWWQSITVPIPPIYSIQVNKDKTITPDIDEQLVGGVMTLYVPDAQVKELAVTSWGRTTQQSLKTQGLTDITVTRITRLTYGIGLATRVYTGTTIFSTGLKHNLSSQDMIMINGNADADLDGVKHQYYVDVIDDYTVDLYWDVTLINKVQFSKPTLLITTQNSYVQLVQSYASRTSTVPLSPAIIDQSLYNLINTDRLFVSFSEIDLNDLISVTRYYIPPSLLELASVKDAITGVNYNTLIIKASVRPENIITITSMVPTASPGESSYRINATWDPVSNQPVTPFEYKIDPVNKPLYYSAIYRENSFSQTYITKIFLSTTETISVNAQAQPSVESFTVADPYKLVTAVNFPNVVTPFNGVNYYCDLDGVDSLQVSDVYVTNNSGNEVNPALYYWITGNNPNAIKIVFLTDPNIGTSVKQVTVRVAVGNTLMIDGEQIKFASINLNWSSPDYGKISRLSHSVNWTGAADINPYDLVQRVSASDIMASGYYDETWYDNITLANIDYANSNSSNGTYSFNSTDYPVIQYVQSGDKVSFSAVGISTGNLYLVDSEITANGGFYIFNIANNYSVQNITVGEKISFEQWDPFSGPTGAYANVSYTIPEYVGTQLANNQTYTSFTVIESGVNQANTQQWIVRLAEPVKAAYNPASNSQTATYATVNINQFTANTANATQITLNAIYATGTANVANVYPVVAANTVAYINRANQTVPLQFTDTAAADFLNQAVK
jgi:hypothetical protein